MIGRSVVSTHVPVEECRRNRRGRTRKRRDFLLLAVLICAGLILSTTAALNAARAVSPPSRQDLAAAPSKPVEPALSYSFGWLDAHPSPPLPVAARAAIVVDLDSKRVLWARNPFAARAPASLTKMVTAMVALDHTSPDALLRVPPAAAAMPPDRMGLKAGNLISVRDLLYGVFLLSANDAAETLAESILRPDRFLAAMNAKVARLGLRQTHFVNATGLDAPGHQSSSYDLAVIGGWLETHYPLLAQIAATKQHYIPATAGHGPFDTYTLNKMLTLYPQATGLKTGFTDQAGGCLVATAVRGGRHLLAVVLGSPIFFTDARRLLDYGFSVHPAPAFRAALTDTS